MNTNKLYAFVFANEYQYRSGGYNMDGTLGITYYNAPIRLSYKKTTTAIDEIKVNDYKLINNVIYFNDTVNEFKLYDLQGKLIYQSTGVSEVELPSVNKGVYVVKADDKSFKIKL